MRDRGARVGVVGMMLLDHPSRAVVQPHPASGAELAVHRLPRQRVHERVARVLLLDEPAGHREVQQVEAWSTGAPASSATRSGSMRRPSTAAAVSARTPPPAAGGSAAAARRGCRRAPGVSSASTARGRAGPPAAGRTAGRRTGCRRSRRRRSSSSCGVVRSDRGLQQLADRGGVEPVEPDPLGPCARQRGHRVDQGRRRCVASVVRRVHTTATGARSADPARWWSSWSDVASAQWRSSSTSNSGCSSAELLRPARRRRRTSAGRCRHQRSAVSSPPRSGVKQWVASSGTWQPADDASHGHSAGA